MSLYSSRKEFKAGYSAGWRDAKAGKPPSLFREQHGPFVDGYRAGHEEAQLAPQETSSDGVSDLLLAYDLEQERRDEDESN